LKTENIWVSWFGGVARGLFEKSFLNNSPMLPFLQSVVEGKTQQTPWTMAAVNVATGVYTEFN
jgi:hypothetical protein